MHHPHRFPGYRCSQHGASDIAKMRSAPIHGINFSNVLKVFYNECRHTTYIQSQWPRVSLQKHQMCLRFFYFSCCLAVSEGRLPGLKKHHCKSDSKQKGAVQKKKYKTVDHFYVLHIVFLLLVSIFIAETNLSASLWRKGPIYNLGYIWSSAHSYKRTNIYACNVGEA